MMRWIFTSTKNKIKSQDKSLVNEKGVVAGNLE